MDINKLEKNLTGRGIDFKYFETGAEAAAYLAEELSGASVGFGGSKTAEALGLYEALQEKSEPHWHWKQDPAEARAAAMTADAYVCGINGLSETGEIVNIDGMGNRVAGTIYGHKKVYMLAGANKVCPDLESAIHRARNVAAPLNVRRMGLKTPCAQGELKCWDCRSPERACGTLNIIMYKMMGMEKMEVVLINQELGY